MKSIISTIIIIVGAIAISALILRQNPSPETTTDNIVSDTGEVQHLSIKAKGGFAPELSNLKANTKTILDIETKDTFDCSATLVIPKLKIARTLPSTGLTQIEIPPQPAGSTLTGICSMNMYRFEIRFQS